LTIGYNQRFLISDPRRYPAICYQTSKIEDTQPIGLTKLKFTQETFNPTTDNFELMLADYYKSEVEPSVPNTEPSAINTFTITYNGKKPSVKVGGSEKVFTAQLPEDNHFDIKWSLSDGINTYEKSYENYTDTFGDYTVTTDDRVMKLKVAAKYDLIGTILTIKALCADGSMGEIQVEVIG
jgi:hypothetical protein